MKKALGDSLLLAHNTLSPIEELKSLPRNYSFDKGMKNKDVIITTSQVYHMNRLHRFLEHVEEGVPDRIRILIFGIDGPPVISILSYDGRLISYAIDSSRYVPDTYSIYVGPTIELKSEEHYNYVLKNYYLIERTGKKRRLFGYRDYPHLKTRKRNRKDFMKRQ